jgi:hypothetical protein
VKRFAIAIAALLCSSPAFAHGHRHHHYRHYAHHRHGMVQVLGIGLAHELDVLASHPAGCPARAFCGCGVSVKVYGHSVRNLWLASNWYRFPRTYAHSGAVAVRNHHVFYIEQTFGDGTVLAYDPNSGGHMTRIHRISLAGYTVVQP